MLRSRIGLVFTVLYLLMPVLIFIMNWLYRSDDEAILIYFMLLGIPFPQSHAHFRRMWRLIYDHPTAHNAITHCRYANRHHDDKCT